MTSTASTRARPPAVRPFRPRTGLAWLAGVAASGLGLSAVYAQTGLGLPCPFRALTGWWCPLCGGTRMGAALLHGDVVAAFWFNPLALVGLLAATLVGICWLVEAAGGPAARLPGALRRVRPGTWWIVLGIVALVFTVARNILR